MKAMVTHSNPVECISGLAGKLGKGQPSAHGD